MQDLILSALMATTIASTTWAILLAKKANNLTKEKQERFKRKEEIINKINRILKPTEKIQLEKLREEAQEVESILPQYLETFDIHLSPEESQCVQNDMLNELGDILLVAHNLCHQLSIDPDSALDAALDKNEERLNIIDLYVDANDETLNKFSLAERQKLWSSAKIRQSKKEH